jgi:hypothetical protein
MNFSGSKIRRTRRVGVVLLCLRQTNSLILHRVPHYAPIVVRVGCEFGHSTDAFTKLPLFCPA